MMADPKGDSLLVNLSASRARSRLRGFGHGVRKVQSAGRNQALIIHTASGKHLAELQAKFADVGFSGDGAALSEPVDNLRNIGAASAEAIRAAGVRTIADVKHLGPALVYQMVKQRQPQTGLDLLWALVAGLEDRDWRELSEDEKETWIARVTDR